MATAPVRRCWYCGGELRGDTDLLDKADSSGFFGYCADSPSQAHRATSYGRAVLRPCPPLSVSNSERSDWQTMTGGSLDEQARRAMYRAIADGTVARHIIEASTIESGTIKAGEVMAPLPKRQWRDGTCERCGTETLVVGPDVQPLCVYCDELRVLPPLPATPRQEKTLVRPARSPLQQRRSDRRGVAWFCVLGVIMLGIPSEIAQTLAACLFGLAVIYGLSSW
jgi:hypothetical protein